MAETPKMDTLYPPVGFSFQVQFSGTDSSPAASFQEVSGISAKMETEEISEGGENRFAHRIPGRVKYEDLVLKRGLMVKNTQLTQWCLDTINGGLQQAIQPKDIEVTLSNEEEKPLMAWTFFKAYPVKWEVLNLNSENNELVVEKLAFTYTYFAISTTPE